MAEKEPARYFNTQTGQWWSVEKGEWIDPDTVIRYGGQRILSKNKMPTPTEESENSATMLNETEEYIKKIEEVEKSRELSRTSSSEMSKHVEAEVSIVVEQFQEQAGLNDTEKESVVEEEAEGGKTPEEFYKENGYDDPAANKTVFVVEAGEILTPEQIYDKEEENEAVSAPGITLIIEGGEVLTEEKEVDDTLAEETAKSSEAASEYSYTLSEGPDVRVDTPSAEEYYKQNGYDQESLKDTQEVHMEFDAEDKDEAAGDRIASLHEIVEATPVVEEAAGGQDRIASLHQEVEAPLSPPQSETDRVSGEDRIPSLHEVVDVKSPEPVAKSKKPGPQVDLPSKEAETEYEDRVRLTISQYKSEKGKSNIDVLRSIEKTDGENPDVKRILAWAKGSKKPATETMVVRQKKHEEKIRRAVDFGGLDVVIASKTAAPKPQAKENKVIEVESGEFSYDWCRNVLMEMFDNKKVVVTNAKVTPSQGGRLVRVDADVSDEKSVLSLMVKNAAVDDKDYLFVNDLAKRLISFAKGFKQKIPLTSVRSAVFTDSKYVVLDYSGFEPLGSDKLLDEAHLKVGVKALAQLHAVSFAYYKNGGDAELLKKFLDSRFLSSASTAEREATKAELEKNLELICAAMDQSGASKGEVEKVKGLKSSIFNIYKEAAVSTGILTVLCHGSPTVSNLLFQYSADGQPTEAQLVNFSECRYASAATDIHIFLKTAGSNSAREDFLLRFVYFETLVSELKVFGIKAPLTYDDLKAEYAKKKLYGLIQSSALLLQSGDVKGQARTTPALATATSPTGVPKAVNSKILGKFFPATKVAAVVNMKGTRGAGAGPGAPDASPGHRVRDMMGSAVKL